MEGLQCSAAWCAGWGWGQGRVPQTPPPPARGWCDPWVSPGGLAGACVRQGSGTHGSTRVYGGGQCCGVCSTLGEYGICGVTAGPAHVVSVPGGGGSGGKRPHRAHLCVYTGLGAVYSGGVKGGSRRQNAWRPRSGGSGCISRCAIMRCRRRAWGAQQQRVCASLGPSVRLGRRGSGTGGDNPTGRRARVPLLLGVGGGRCRAL